MTTAQRMELIAERAQALDWSPSVPDAAGRYWYRDGQTNRAVDALKTQRGVWCVWLGGINQRPVRYGQKQFAARVRNMKGEFKLFVAPT